MKSSNKQRKLEARKEKIRRRCANDFAYFFLHIFPYSFENFITGDYIVEIADFLQDSQKTIRVGPRDHLKSTSIYAHFMWLLLKARYSESDLEAHYFSYNKSMATYHVGSPKNEDNIKDLIARNPFFDSINDDKENADTVAVYNWEGSSNQVTLTSHGLLTFTRGMHTRGVVYVDDPFQDESDNTRLDPTKVKTINNKIQSVVDSIPQYDQGGQLHIVGTPQTDQDFFFDPDFTKTFDTKIQPSILDDEEKKVLFPEWRPYDWLASKRDALPKRTWLREYMVHPTYSLNSYLVDEDVKECINPNLTNYIHLDYKAPDSSTMVGGLDIGKHQHPSHLAVFELTETGKMIQRLSKWMDNWGYTEQVEFCRRLFNEMGLDILYYDATRGEFESLEETGKLPDNMRGVNLTGRKTRFSLARSLVQKVEKNDILFLDDGRQYRQMLLVDSDLKARETSEGHGDSFWSIALTQEIENKTDAKLIFA